MRVNLTWLWQTMLVLTIKRELKQKQCSQWLTATIQQVQHDNMYKPDGLWQQTVDWYDFAWKLHFWTSDFWQYLVCQTLDLWLQNLIIHLCAKLLQVVNLVQFSQAVYKLSCAQTFSIWSHTVRQHKYRMHSAANCRQKQKNKLAFHKIMRGNQW